MNGRLRLTTHAAIATIGASLSLSAVYSDLRWLMPVIGAILVVTVVCELVRRTPIPALFGPILAAGAVLCYITWLDARSVAVFDIFPGSDALHSLGVTVRRGFDDIRHLATPVPSHTGLVLLAVIAMATIALVVDLIAVTMRRAAAAGLPLLAVFAVSTSVARHGVSWIAFGLGTAAYLALLLADSRERIARWGRTLGVAQGTRVTWADQGISPSPLSALGRRIGAAAIAIGVVVPLLIPGLHGGLPKHGSDGSGNGRGGGSVETINPIVSLRKQLVSPTATPLLSYTSTDPQPPYLRLTSLSEFDGETFSPKTLVASARDRVSNGITAPPVTGTNITTKVHVGNLGLHWLPLPVQVESVKVSGDWRYVRESNTVFSARVDTTNATYTASSIEPQPSAAQLERVPVADAQSFAGYLTLPTTLQTDITSLAQKIVKGARTPFDRALAIQRFLTSTAFSYDTSVPGSDSSDALEEFLFASKRGFCQQFAAAMAVLARIVQLPSRVAVGFTHGEHQSDGSWLVTTHDAHAWPEIYFEGYGWLPFEPTPRGDGQAVEPAFTTTQSPSSGGGDGSDTPAPQPSTTPGRTAADLKGLDSRDANSGPAPAATAKHSRTSKAPLLVALAILVALALPAPAVARRLATMRRWRGVTGAELGAHAAWAELRACAIDARTLWQDGLSPRASGRLLRAEGGLDGAASDALSRLVTAEERARYAPAPPVDSGGSRIIDDGAVARLRADVASVRSGLLARCSLPQRLAAVVAPPSTMIAARAAAARFADVLDALDVLGARARRWVGRRFGRVAHPLAERSPAGS